MLLAGTVSYMSPEVIDSFARGVRVDDPTGDAGLRSDCYSVGVIIWQLVTGTRVGRQSGPGTVFPSEVPLWMSGPQFKPFVELVRGLLCFEPAKRATMVMVRGLHGGEG